MKHGEGRFTGQNKLSIFWQCWRPEKARAVVVLAHGLGEHSGRYAHVAEALNKSGCSVYAIDHRGHGKSGGPRVLVDRYANAVADIDQLVDLANEAAPAKPLFLLGHSMGGALALGYAIKHQHKLKGLMLSGPAVALVGTPPGAKPVIKLLSRLLPKLRLLGIDPAGVSRDLNTVADYASDPLNFHGKLPARTLGEMIAFIDALPAQLPTLTLPLLIQHGSNDKLTAVAGSEMVLAGVSSKDKTLQIYEGLYHEIFNELPTDRARVLADSCAWLEQHLPG